MVKESHFQNNSTWASIWESASPEANILIDREMYSAMRREGEECRYPLPHLLCFFACNSVKTSDKCHRCRYLTTYPRRSSFLL